MAIGDVVSGLQSIASGAQLDIRPGAGVEWVLHNIYHEDSAILQFYDGTLTLAFSTQTGPQVISNLQMHVNNTRRIRVTNNAATSKLIGYDGVQTK